MGCVLDVNLDLQLVLCDQCADLIRWDGRFAGA